MKILILNGSPKGPQSTTLQTARYLAALHPEHEWSELEAGLRLRSLEQDFSPARKALREAELLLFCYPVYTFLAPFQLHRFLELIREDGVDLRGKFASQITTSKHFYDVTAHRCIEENCCDLGLLTVRGLSADMDDLLTERGRREARDFYRELLFRMENRIFVAPPLPKPAPAPFYERRVEQVPKTLRKDVVIVTNCAPEDRDLKNRIEDFKAALPAPCRVVNVREFPFAGGCLGCFGCAADGICVYRDGFDSFLRAEIQQADAIVYAMAVEHHYTHSSMKCYDDRQFCNGHRTVTRGIPAAYLLRGDLAGEPNLRMLIEARCEVGGNYLAGTAADGDSIEALARSLAFALEQGLSRPANFYGVGGMKIFRDLIWEMRGLMKADHRFYRENGIYDFPQKKHGRILQMKLVGGMMALPPVRKRLRGRMNRFIIEPYQRVVEAAGDKK